ncbi:MAG: PH domain-containing protein [Chloroflexi bacterium]|nr:PH domain-containing protein [Chloroflexota bacterium]
MSTPKRLTPDPKYATKLKAVVWLVFVFLVLPLVLLGLVPELGWTYVLIFLAANALWLVPTLLLIGPYYRSISYELTESEVIVRKGIITHTVQTVPFSAVVNVDVTRGPLDRWLGLGTTHVHTAGYSQQTTAEAKLAGLREYQAAYEAILAAVRARRQGESARELEGEPAGRAATTTQVLSELLEELRAVRQLLERRGE